MSEFLPGIIWLIVLLAVNAFFVGAEFAVISARRSQIEPLAAAGNRAAKTTLWAMEHATLMLATSQLGITVASLVILNVSEPAIHHLLQVPLAWTGLTPAVVSSTAFVIALLLVTFLHVVFGEMVPKNLAFSVPDRAALLLAPPLVVVSRLVQPLIASLNWVANLFLRMVGVQPKAEATSTYTIDQVATIVDQSKREGTITDTGGTLSAVFEFTEKRVGELMVDVKEVVQLPLTATPFDVQRRVAAQGFSRYVFADAQGIPSRYVHVKDLLSIETPEALSTPIEQQLTRELPTVTQDTELEDALDQMRVTGSHIARVGDGAGAIAGVIFLEDIIEELIGEVTDRDQRAMVPASDRTR